jgi:exonuclease VII small subunit
MKEEEIKKLQETVRKLEERVAKLEKAFGSQEMAREATAVNKAVKATEAGIHKFDKE